MRAGALEFAGLVGAFHLCFSTGRLLDSAMCCRCSVLLSGRGGYVPVLISVNQNNTLPESCALNGLGSVSGIHSVARHR